MLSISIEIGTPGRHPQRCMQNFYLSLSPKAPRTPPITSPLSACRRDSPIPPHLYALSASASPALTHIFSMASASATMIYIQRLYSHAPAQPTASPSLLPQPLFRAMILVPIWTAGLYKSHHSIADRRGNVNYQHGSDVFTWRSWCP